MELINNRINNPVVEGYYERHHILPRSLGGSDEQSNLVNLTAREHYVAHALLVMIYRDNKYKYYKMLNAYYIMSHCKSSTRTYNSRMYAKFKKDYSIYKSLSQTGIGNSQAGTRWIYNVILKECKKVLKSDKIPDGWLKGRVVKWNNFDKPKKLCIYCNTRETQTKYSKYCSTKCKEDMLFESCYIYQNRLEFISHYKDCKSINNALKRMGKNGQGGWYDHAVRLISQHEDLLFIYNKSKK